MLDVVADPTTMETLKVCEFRGHWDIGDENLAALF